MLHQTPCTMSHHAPCTAAHSQPCLYHHHHHHHHLHPCPQLPLVLKLRDVAAGMRHLHELSICHGDLKSDNVLLASSARVRGDATGTVAKIADFGLSRVLLPGQTHLSTRWDQAGV